MPEPRTRRSGSRKDTSEAGGHHRVRPARLEALAKAIPGPAPWARLAACRDTPGVDFFVEAVRNRVDMHETIKRAKEVCEGCSVRLSCLEAGLREPFGIWGGLTVRERRKLRRSRQEAA